MSDRPGVYPRIQRRETHSSRAVPAIVLAVVLILALAYLVTEIVLAALSAHPLLGSPATMVQDLAMATSVATAYLVIGGVVGAIVGIVLVVLAVSAGRRPRHVLRDDRAVVVVDDEVIASALVRTAADAGDVNPDRAVGTVGTRSATVTITPASGLPVDGAAVTGALREQLGSWGLKPALRPRTRIRSTGKVGA